MSETLYLAHHGIKGQKWGVRRFQEEDGSLTPAGRDRYSDGKNKKRLTRKEHYEIAKYNPSTLSSKKDAESFLKKQERNKEKGMDDDLAYAKAIKSVRQNKAFRSGVVSAVVAGGGQLVQQYLKNGGSLGVNDLILAGSAAAGGFIGGYAGTRVGTIIGDDLFGRP